VILAMLAASSDDAVEPMPPTPTAALPTPGQVTVAAGAATVANSTEWTVGATSCSGQRRVVPA
jgi:hypothetical protein